MLTFCCMSLTFEQLFLKFRLPKLSSGILFVSSVSQLYVVWGITQTRQYRISVMVWISLVCIRVFIDVLRSIHALNKSWWWWFPFYVTHEKYFSVTWYFSNAFVINIRERSDTVWYRFWMDPINTLLNSFAMHWGLFSALGDITSALGDITSALGVYSA